MPNFLPEQLHASFLPVQDQRDFLPMTRQDRFLTRQFFLPEQILNDLQVHLQAYCSPKQEQGYFLPGESHYKKLIDQIISQIKSDGVFDQFRRECLSDGDMTPAYRNLNQRFEANVKTFLSKQTFAGNLSKIQLREQLRKNITESGILEANVGRIVDQVVDPKINTAFRPKVQEEIYKYLEKAKPATATNNSELQDRSRIASAAAEVITGEKGGKENKLKNFGKITKFVERLSESHDKHKLAGNCEEKKDNKNHSSRFNKSDNSNNKVRSVLKPCNQKNDKEGKQSQKGESAKKNSKGREKDEDKTRHIHNQKSDKEKSHTSKKSSVEYKKSLLENENRLGKHKIKLHNEKLDKNKCDRERSSTTKHGDVSVSLSGKKETISKEKITSDKNEESSIKNRNSSKSYHKHTSSNKSKLSSGSSKGKNDRRDRDLKSDKQKLKKAVNDQNSFKIENNDRRHAEEQSYDCCSEISCSVNNSSKAQQNTADKKLDPESSTETKTKVMTTAGEKVKSRSLYRIETRQSKKKKAAEMANIVFRNK